jgi:hypothetical protein
VSDGGLARAQKGVQEVVKGTAQSQRRRRGRRGLALVATIAAAMGDGPSVSFLLFNINFFFQ